jgi:hypothetical protein
MTGGPGIDSLTEQQKLILDHIRAGRMLGEIAHTLGYSLGRVNDAVIKLRARFGLVAWVSGEDAQARYRIVPPKERKSL